MQRRFYTFLSVLFLFFSIARPAFANLYINEFSSNSDPDWVEIYNSDSSSVDLSNYLLRDSTDSNKIQLSGSIDGHGFATFDWSNKLNNDGDTIRLLVVNEGGTENSEDQVVYGSGGQVGAPSSGQTAGRTPDGSGAFAILSSSSKNSSNNSSSAVPTATPTQTPAPTPTHTPTPTKTPTPAPTATPTKIPTPTPTIFRPTPTDIITPTNDPNSDLKLAANASGNNIFGNATPTEEPKAAVLGISTFAFSWGFIALGLIFISVCGILLYFQFGNRLFEIFKKKSTGL